MLICIGYVFCTNCNSVFKITLIPKPWSAAPILGQGLRRHQPCPDPKGWRNRPTFSSPQAWVLHHKLGFSRQEHISIYKWRHVLHCDNEHTCMPYSFYLVYMSQQPLSTQLILPLSLLLVISYVWLFICFKLMITINIWATCKHVTRTT